MLFMEKNPGPLIKVLPIASVCKAFITYFYILHSNSLTIYVPKIGADLHKFLYVSIHS